MARSERRRLVPLLGVVVAASLVACNGILGLSDYERGECSGGEICFDSGAPDVRPDARDGGPDIQNLDASGTKPVRWAHFVMPNSDAGTATENVPSYTVGNGEILDTVSRLTWGEPVPTGTTSYEDAEKACAALTTGGARWRLPSRIELVTLLDLGRATGAKIDAKFGSTEPRQYWTTSEVRPDPNGARTYWTVDFAGGGLAKQDAKTGGAGVRCIKGE